MQKVDFKNDQLTARDKEYIARMTKSHKQKVAKLVRTRTLRRNTFFGIGLATVALGVYGYSIYAVSQESFLEDFDDPNKPKS